MSPVNNVVIIYSQLDDLNRLLPPTSWNIIPKVLDILKFKLAAGTYGGFHIQFDSCLHFSLRVHRFTYTLHIIMCTVYYRIAFSVEIATNIRIMGLNFTFITKFKVQKFLLHINIQGVFKRSRFLVTCKLAFLWLRSRVGQDTV